jgi:hypothetical protein
MLTLRPALAAALLGFLGSTAFAQEKPVVGLIPRAAKPIQMDGKLDEWDGAFVTPVHIGHPDFANRAALFYYLWDDDNLYIGQRCLDRTPAHVGSDKQIYNGDAVEFYLDTRRGDQLGAAQFGPGSLHMFYTPFTKTEIKPRLQVRDIPAFRGFKLQGAEVAATKSDAGYVVEFKLPWKNFPDFRPKAGEVIGIDCELCSSDGGPRADRTFVYSGPSSVGTPATFGRVRLVEKIDPAELQPCSRALLPASLNVSANYGTLYGTACVSPTLGKLVRSVEGKIVGPDGKTRKTTAGNRAEASGFDLWRGAWEFFDLPPGPYTVELLAKDAAGRVIVARRVPVALGTNTPAE